MKDSKNGSKQKVYIVPIILVIALWIILFLPAGSLGFKEAWIFWAGFSMITFFIAVYFNKTDPKLLVRRMNYKEKGPANRTPAILKLYYLGFILPGLDFRFDWSNVPFSIVVFSNIIAFLGYIFIVCVFKENSYASTVIQIETEQKVIASGPYSIVRHPMYLGMLIISLFIPFSLGSYFAIIPMLFIFPITVLRIKGEEQLLLNSLNGYKEYCLKTRYRLIPFIW